MMWTRLRISWTLGITILGCIIISVRGGREDYGVERRLEPEVAGRVSRFAKSSQRLRNVDSDSGWGGKWFPGPMHGRRGQMMNREGGAGGKKDQHGRIPMGVANADCDDAKNCVRNHTRALVDEKDLEVLGEDRGLEMLLTKLTVDWDYSEEDYTCYDRRKRYPLEKHAKLDPIWECEELTERDWVPLHFCMNDTIEYDTVLPTHGDHRPLWPIFGEYLYVPPQRWLHNIEHGSVVMLYHPCADPYEVDALRQLVTGCVGKYVITAERRLSKKRPLALVAWSCRLQMATVNAEIVQRFIRAKALVGPEALYPAEGQYVETLIRASNETGDADYMNILC